MAGKLFVVATPIGNLGDLTFRALDVLKSVERIAAEDTRRTRQLLSHFQITQKRVDALHAHSSAKDVARLVEHLLAGESIAVVTDAGTPIVSDPGDALVSAALAAGVDVVPIPGASAVLAALVGSGLTGSGFRFLGFLPRDGAARRDALAKACDTAEPVVMFESPERVHATLTELAALMPERTACVARELTKLHEEFVRGTLTDLATREEWRGEIVIVLGTWDPAARVETVDNTAIAGRIDEELARGGHAKTVADRIAAWSGRPRREIYELVVRRKNAR